MLSCPAAQVRAKYMTLDASGNRYVHHLQAIRAIQAHLMSAAKDAQVQLDMCAILVSV